MKATLSTLFTWAALSGVALAQDQLPDKLPGYDGIVSQCVIHTKKAFADIMCGGLVGAAATGTAKAGIRHMHLGSADWTGDTTDYLAPAPDSGFESPLYLTFYLRGTDGNPAAAHAWASLYIPHEGAAGPGLPLPGKLVLWEGATLGSGPPKPVAAAVANAVSEKLKPVFVSLGEAMAK